MRLQDDDVPSVPLALSMLCDGEAGDRQVDVALAAWSADTVSREQWAHWQLIGDVLRSSDLASGRQDDEDFLSGLRSRMSAESAPAARSRWSSWTGQRPARAAVRWAGGALAAGVVVLAGLGLAWQGSPALLEGTFVARAAEALGWGSGSSALQAADGTLIRDAQLDAYLRAHRVGAPALPGGATGRFETTALER